MKKLRLIKNNKHVDLSGISLEDLNYQKNKLELENNELFDVCCFSDDDLPLPTNYFKLRPKTIKVFKTKTINIRNDVEQWCDVIGVSQTGGSSKETSTIVPQYNIQKNNDIVKSKISFIPMTIFTPNYWYCNSVEFNVVAQYYKGNHHKLSSEDWESWYIHEGKDLISEKEKEFLPFVNFIKRIGFNYE